MFRLQAKRKKGLLLKNGLFLADRCGRSRGIFNDLGHPPADLYLGTHFYRARVAVCGDYEDRENRSEIFPVRRAGAFCAADPFDHPQFLLQQRVRAGMQLLLYLQFGRRAV